MADKPRPPSTAPSDWAVEHTSMETAVGSRWIRGSVKTHHTLGAYLLAPESDPYAHEEKPSRRGSRPANLDVSANWITKSAGEFVRPNIGPEHSPEQWEDAGGGVKQGLLFRRPETVQAPTVEWMRSTKSASRRAGTGLGIVQNEVERRGQGQLSELGSESGVDLSPHSAKLVGKLTGREHETKNDMDFMDEGDIDRRDLEVPRQGEGGSFHVPKTEFGDTQNVRILSRGEANMGLSRFRVALSESPMGQKRSAKIAARKRASQPTVEQGTLFPEPGGLSAKSSQRRGDYRNKYGVTPPKEL